MTDFSVIRRLATSQARGTRQLSLVNELLTAEQVAEGLETLLQLAAERYQDWEEYVNGPHGSGEHSEEGKVEYRRAFRNAEAAYGEVMATIEGK